MSLSLFLLSNTQIALHQAAAQNETSSLDTPNSTEDTKKNYILVFGQRTVGNIDNFTKIVYSIVGHNQNRRRIFRRNKFSPIPTIRGSN